MEPEAGAVKSELAFQAGILIACLVDSVAERTQLELLRSFSLLYHFLQSQLKGES